MYSQELEKIAEQVNNKSIQNLLHKLTLELGSYNKQKKYVKQLLDITKDNPIVNKLFTKFDKDLDQLNNTYTDILIKIK